MIERTERGGLGFEPVFGRAAVKLVLASVGVDVAQELESDQEAAHGSAGKRGGARDFGDGQAFGMTCEAFDHAEAASQRQDEIRIAFVHGEFAAPPSAKSRQRLRWIAWFDGGFGRRHCSLAYVICCAEHTARRLEFRLKLFDGTDGEKLG